MVKFLLSAFTAVTLAYSQILTFPIDFAAAFAKKANDESDKRPNNQAVFTPQMPFFSKSFSGDKEKTDDEPRDYVRIAIEQERLYKRIVYSPSLTRPDLTNIPFDVTVRLMLIKLLKIVEKQEYVELTLRIQIGWHDQRLEWDKDKYGGITEIVLPSSAIWMPDLTVINSVGDVYQIVRDTRFEVKILNNGQVWWHPTGVLRTFCNLRLSYFPLDRQKCPIIIESPTFDSRFLNLQLRKERNPVDLRMYVESETWHLIKTFGTFQNMKVGRNTYFARLEFWLILDRARMFHTINFILPSFILSAIQAVFLLLPVSHPQRVGSATVTMLSVMVFQSMVVDQLPKTSESVPLLSVYIDIIILVSATSVVTSVSTALCQFNYDRQIPLPQCLKLFLSYKHRNPIKNIPSKEHLGAVLKDSKSEHVFLNLPKSTATDTNLPQDFQAPTSRRHQLMKMNSFAGNTTTPSHASAGYRQYTKAHRKSMAEPETREFDEDREIPERYKRNRRALRRNTLIQWPTFSTEWETGTLASDFTARKSNANGDKTTTWLDVLKVTDTILSWTCGLAITIGPVVIFGIIPHFVDYQDYPEPVGYNFTLEESVL